MTVWMNDLETLDREQLRNLQARRLRELLTAVRGRHEYWGRRLKESDLDPDRVTLESFRDFPLSSKADLLADQQAAPPWGSRYAPVAGQAAHVYETSGTSGLGQEAIALTPHEVEKRGSAYPFIFSWAGLEPGDSMLLTLPISMQSGGQTYSTGAVQFGLTCFASGTYDARKKIDLLSKYEITALLASPTYINRLEVVAREMGLDPATSFPALTNILTFAEPYPQSWPEQVAKAWGVRRVSEQWGLAQAGSVTITCENGCVTRPDGQRPMMHSLGAHTYLEVLDPATGEPVAPGEWGEMVVTRLFTHRNPMIRFRTGDKGKFLPAEYCPCGRPFDGIECGTVGRYDDMMKIRGMNVFPSAIDDIVLGGMVEEYRGTVDVDSGGSEQVEILLDFGRRAESLTGEETSAYIRQVERSIKERVGITVAVRTAPANSLPRFEFKARRWTDSRRRDRKVIAYTEDGAK